MKKIFLLLLSATFIMISSNLIAAEGQIEWKSYNEGMSLSKKSGKNIFIYFQTSWCKFCEQMKNTTFKDKKVISYLNENFVPISVDGDKETDLVKKFGVRGYPDSVFVEGDKKFHRPGYVPPEMFYLIISYVRTKSYLKMSFSQFAKNNKQAK